MNELDGQRMKGDKPPAIIKGGNTLVCVCGGEIIIGAEFPDVVRNPNLQSRVEE